MLSYVLSALAASAVLASPPVVKLDKATFAGASDGVVNRFLGIPFAKPPVGPLRFNAPVPVEPYEGLHSALAFGAQCPQQVAQLPVPPGLPSATLQFLQAIGSLGNQNVTESEDCLSVNVVTPLVVKPGANLPVAVWIYGGGFEVGGSSMYDGGVIVKRSIALNEPVVYVSMNYRVTAFGFLASKEVKAAGLGNFGMQDQRLAFRWVQKYIAAFGGDPSRVTIWGESAGAISVALHMLTNNGNTEHLFQGAVMQSGGPIPSMGDIESGQTDYDALVKKTGCTASADTLACLRQVDYNVLKAAVDDSPSIYDFPSLRLVWVPRADGKFLTAPPMELVQRGSVANVPFITGNCDDEGTLFSFAPINVTTDQEFHDYVQGNYMPTVPDAGIERVLQAYPSDPVPGSPFDTGMLNALTPQFKRLASFQGDWIFQGPRRFLLRNRASKQNAWSFLTKRFKTLPILGATHGTDIFNVYGGGDLADYLIHFVNHLDPNGKTANTSVAWPQYDTSAPKLLTFLDDAQTPVTVTEDTYRVKELQLLQDLALKYPL